MWNIVLTVNSALVVTAATFFVYSIGAALILGAWKQLLLSLIVLLFLIATEIALAAINS